MITAATMQPLALALMFNVAPVDDMLSSSNFFLDFLITHLKPFLGKTPHLWSLSIRSLSYFKTIAAKSVSYSYCESEKYLYQPL